MVCFLSYVLLFSCTFYDHWTHRHIHIQLVDFSIIHCFHFCAVLLSISPFVCTNLWVYYVPLKLNKEKKDQTRALFHSFIDFNLTQPILSHHIASQRPSVQCTMCKTVYDTMFNDKHTKENWIIMAPFLNGEWSDFLRFSFAYLSIFRIISRREKIAIACAWHKTCENQSNCIPNGWAKKYHQLKLKIKRMMAHMRSWWSVLFREQSKNKERKANYLTMIRQLFNANFPQCLAFALGIIFIN